MGGIATSLLDLRPTSLDYACPGIVIHGAIFNAIMTGKMWRVAPWQVAFAYVDETGAQQSGRSTIFAPGAASGFHLALPDPRWRLQRVEVQQFGASQTVTTQGSLFSTRSTWVLVDG